MLLSTWPCASPCPSMVSRPPSARVQMWAINNAKPSLTLARQTSEPRPHATESSGSRSGIAQPMRCHRVECRAGGEGAPKTASTHATSQAQRRRPCGTGRASHGPRRWTRKPESSSCMRNAFARGVCLNGAGSCGQDGRATTQKPLPLSPATSSGYHTPWLGEYACGPSDASRDAASSLGFAR